MAADAGLDPGANVSVSASAGTGKTWLLTARITRLLLAGAAPGGILALTFTRKAAAEMQTRVYQRLRDLALADEAAAAQQLGELGLTVDAALLARARSLYEDVLFSPWPLRTTTLHAFCQDLVARFALQTGTAPGFEVAEDEGALLETAWQGLQRAWLAPQAQTLGAALDELVAQGYSEHRLHEVVLGFLQRRNDWRALTGTDGADSLVQLRSRLEQRLQVTPDEDPALALDSPAFSARVRMFCNHLDNAGGGIGTVKSQLLLPALEQHGTVRLQTLWQGLFTKDDEARKFTIGETKRRQLGSGAADHCAQIHAELVHELQAVHERRLRQRTLRRTLAAATLGVAALRCFEDALQQRNLLPFTDLEWRACRLLADPEAGNWVQYRLDARIEHLLMDEFQDTSDTQWQLLLPLLQEMAQGAAAGSERPRSAFIVGDSKQSIYGFRRANARLLDEAGQWMSAHMGGQRTQLSASRRSAPAVMDFVNALFSAPDGGLPDFPAHRTHRSDLWGCVELAPLVPDTREKKQTVEFRNPLTTPRPDPENDRACREGALIAQRIRALMSAGWAFDGRALAYGDIMILLRKRTHQQALEQALSGHGIPFVGSARGTLLQTVELSDLLALLRFLASPVRDLDLAHALRSPLFAASDEDLVQLALAARIRQQGWWPALQAATAPQFARAQRLLGAWLPAARRLPAHDLFDQIVCESDAAARYEAALPPAQAARARANLGAFAQLLLQTDSGRYPALPRVLRQLQDTEADESPPAQETGGGAVRILTIHAAKGLEAPVVFLAQVVGAGRNPGAGWQVEWPAGAARPEDFLLVGNKDERDTVSAALLQAQAAREQREELNLLYVACTRARQFLHISGFEMARGADGSWFERATAALQALSAGDVAGVRQHRSGVPAAAPAARPRAAGPVADARLRQPLAVAMSVETRPSAQDDVPEPLAVRRGIAIHLLLQNLADGVAETRWPALLAARLGSQATPAEYSGWSAEARAVIAAPALARFFDPAQFRRAWNEVPLHYDRVSGVIDRLVDDGETLWLLDYKTERADDPPQLLARYRTQLLSYVEGLRRLWPQRRLHAGLVLTASAQWLPLPD